MNNNILKLLALIQIFVILFMLSSCSSSEKRLDFEVLPDAQSDLAHYLEINSDSSLEIPQAAGNAFFENAVFIGDSVSLRLKNYATELRSNGQACLANAEFLVSGSMSYTNAIRELNEKDAVHPKYKGEYVMIEDGVAQIGATKAFIMLGMNDFCLDDFETGIRNAETLINNIIKKNEGIEIYVQSVTPMLATKEHGKFNNDNIDKFNICLEEMCHNNSWTFIDVNPLFKDDNNCLKPEYCSDPDSQGIHFSSEACGIWVEYLISQF